MAVGLSSAGTTVGHDFQCLVGCRNAGDVFRITENCIRGIAVKKDQIFEICQLCKGAMHSCPSYLRCQKPCPRCWFCCSSGISDVAHLRVVATRQPLVAYGCMLLRLVDRPFFLWNFVFLMTIRQFMASFATAVTFAFDLCE